MRAPHDRGDDRRRPTRTRTASPRPCRPAAGHATTSSAPRSTSRWMPASAVSSPTAVTSTRSPESVATVPATTVSPTAAGHRSGTRRSPSTRRSRRRRRRCRRRPGTLPPGRTMTTSPTRSSAVARRSVTSLAVGHSTRSASSGSSAASESSADVVCASDRISIQWPSSMITISSASSHQKSSSWCSTPRLAPQDEHERDGDRQPDEQHHSRCAGTDFADRPGEERAAAPHVHDRAEHRRHPVRCQGTSGSGVAEDHREHAGQRDRRDGQHQHDPEQPAELRDVIGVPAGRMTVLSGVVGMRLKSASRLTWVMFVTIYP